jgi:hypothetical protein
MPERAYASARGMGFASIVKIDGTRNRERDVDDVRPPTTASARA